MRLDEDDKPKIILKLIIKCLLHNFDMYSDWLYLLTVPTYHCSIQTLLLLFIALPIGFCILFGVVAKNFAGAFIIFFGLLPLHKVINEKIDNIRTIDGEIGV